MKVTNERELGTPLTASQLKELEEFEGRPIDTSDIPDTSTRSLKNAT